MSFLSGGCRGLGLLSSRRWVTFSGCGCARVPAVAPGWVLALSSRSAARQAVSNMRSARRRDACGPTGRARWSGGEFLEDLALRLDPEQQGHAPADQGDRGEDGEDVADAEVGDHEG